MIAEKRYCIAAKIVDTYLDPPTNDHLRGAFTADRETKIQLANDLLECLSPDTLNTFARAYRVATPGQLNAALELVIAEAHSTLSPELSALLHGARSHIDDIAQTEGWQSGKGVDGINLPALLSLFQMIEALGRETGIPISRFVHDETATHEEAYRATFETFARLGDTVLSLPGDSLPASGFKAIQRFETQASEHSPFVQAADVLAGSLGRACKLVASGASMTSQQRDVYSTIFAPLITRQPFALAWPVASNAFLRNLGRTLGWTSNEHKNEEPATAQTAVVFPKSNTPPPDPDRVEFPCPAWGLMKPAGELLIVRTVSQGRSMHRGGTLLRNTA